MDCLAQARAGLGHALNPEGEPPSPSPVLIADFASGLLANAAALARLLARAVAVPSGSRRACSAERSAPASRREDLAPARQAGVEGPTGVVGQALGCGDARG